MIIRKLYRFEGAHRVRACSSSYCRDNIHGHSYIVEVFITSDKLDNGCMLLDFGLLKPVKEFIESFDHAYALWDKEEEHVKQAIRTINPRYIEMPISPSSEGFALLFLFVIDRIINSLPHNNGEGHIRVHAVRVHETATGYAEATREDLSWINFTEQQIHFSPAIQESWQQFHLK